MAKPRNAALVTSDCPDLKLRTRGKVRDVYEIDDKHLLFVATDRISAFDVVMQNGIPNKGKILTQLSLFWFDLLKDCCPNHLVTADFARMPASVQKYAEQLAGRSMLVHRLDILPIEAIVRGYLAGSGWKEYLQKGSVCGLPLAKGLQESAKLPDPLYTPSTKATGGRHDENISPDRAAAIIGRPHAEAVKRMSLLLYTRARDFAAKRGILIADTKFEFGVDLRGNVVLADEVLTPDSSRFWPATGYKQGRAQESFDKQYVRDYLESVNFNKSGPGIMLPKDIIDRTLTKYVEAFAAITGRQPDL